MSVVEATEGLLEPIEKKQLHERVADEVADQILKRQWGPGDRLPSERAMAQQLGVGRSTIREALALLHLEGLIETRRGAGSVVTEKAEEIINRRQEALGGRDRTDASPSALLDVRELIEPAAARWAATNANPDLYAESLLEGPQELVAVEDPDSRATWNDRDRLFHRQIGVMTGNPIMASLCADIAEMMNQLLWQHLRDDVLTEPDRVSLFEAEHRMIYEAVVSGSPDAAEFHSREHIKQFLSHMALD